MRIVGGRHNSYLAVQVEALSDGRFIYDGPMWRGVKECVGDSARLRHQGIQARISQMTSTFYAAPDVFAL